MNMELEQTKELWEGDGLLRRDVYRETVEEILSLTEEEAIDVIALLTALQI